MIFNTEYKSYAPHREPWANTVAYRPLESNWNDISGNNNNLSNSWTPVYTTVWWASVPSFNNTSNSNYLYSTSISWMTTGTSARTLNFWFYCSWTNSWYNNTLVMIGTASQNNMLNAYFNAGSTTLAVSQYWSSSWNIITLSTNTWYNIVLTYNWTAVKTYVNSELKNTWTYTINTQWNNIYLMQSSWNSNWYTKGNLSKLIFENKERTLDEITEYYNNTKSIYWIS